MDNITKEEFGIELNFLFGNFDNINEDINEDVNDIDENIEEKILFGSIILNKNIIQIKLYEQFINKNQINLNDFKDKDFIKESDINNAKFSLEKAVQTFQANALYSKNAFESIYNHYKPILKRYGQRYNNEELASELLDIVLLNAAKTFNINANTKFNTYFWTCVHNHVNCYRTYNNAKKRINSKDIVSMEDQINYNGNTSDGKLENMIEDDKASDDNSLSELKMSIKSLSNCLTKKEINILLKVVDNYTLAEIGESLGITAAAVCLSLKRLSNKAKASMELKKILTN